MKIKETSDPIYFGKPTSKPLYEWISTIDLKK
jgi:hypothetical protein